MKITKIMSTGDLVRLKRTNLRRHKNWWQIGVIVDCRGIECCVLWNEGPQSHSWWPRNKLEVINESR